MCNFKPAQTGVNLEIVSQRVLTTQHMWATLNFQLPDWNSSKQRWAANEAHICKTHNSTDEVVSFHYCSCPGHCEFAQWRLAFDLFYLLMLLNCLLNVTLYFKILVHINKFNHYLNLFKKCLLYKKPTN